MINLIIIKIILINSIQLVIKKLINPLIQILKFKNQLSKMINNQKLKDPLIFNNKKIIKFKEYKKDKLKVQIKNKS